MRLELQEKLDCDLADRKKEVDELVMEVIDEQTQDDDEEEEESESEEETPPKKRKAVAKKKSADSEESGSEYSPPGSDDDDEDAPPSDGGGSDYEPDEPVRFGRGNKSRKKVSRRDSDGDSSGEEWGKKKGGKKVGRKRAESSDEDDSDYEKPQKKRKSGGGGGGYNAPVKLSADLADIVGGEEMPRHEVVKRMWAYIKENKLQDPKNKAMVKCDEKLSKICPTKKFRGFGMTKFLKEHMNVE